MHSCLAKHPQMYLRNISNSSVIYSMYSFLVVQECPCWVGTKIANIYFIPFLCTIFAITKFDAIIGNMQVVAVWIRDFVAQKLNGILLIVFIAGTGR